MAAPNKTVEIQLQRTIAGAPSEVFDAWLDSSAPGSPWHEHEKLIVAAEVDGLWHWRSHGGTPHYGRFIALERPEHVRHTWMSPYTLGEESTVSVTFDAREQGTLVTLRHAGLPRSMAPPHEQGWRAILDRFGAAFPRGEPQ